ncbi:unnamed protein product [Knipowitschia caucasica]
MPVCKFFLQGRCAYGEKCWNEHPRDGRGGGGGYNSNSRAPPPQQQPRGGGGFGNRVWVNPSQQRGGYVQPSSFSNRENDQWSRRGDSDWGGGGGGGFGRRENVKSSEFSFSQNRFSALDSPSTFDKGGRAPPTAGDDDSNDRKCETIQSDMDAWESSGQWGFSTYSHSKNPLSGFSDLSPEELRLEYYTSRASGNVQNYINGVNQLLSQWRSRVQELKIMNASTKAALIRELNSTAPQQSSVGFGSVETASAFGSKGFGAPTQGTNFSFAAPVTGFGSASVSSASGFGAAVSAPPPSGFGAAGSAPPPSGFGAAGSAPPPSGFGAAGSAPPPSGFGAAGSAPPPSGFGAAGSAPPPSGFGAAGSAPPPSGFGAAGSAPPPSGFGAAGSAPPPSGFGASPAPSASTFSFAAPDKTSTAAPSGFGSAPAFGPATGFASAAFASGASDGLFSIESSLSSEELNQFKAKRFTLGQIPLKPPPANLLVV